MSAEERTTWATGIVTMGALAAYLVVVMNRAGGGSPAEVRYVPIMLWTFGISIVASIAAAVVAAIAHAVAEAVRTRGEVNEAELGRTDERDREIGRRGEMAGYYVLAIGAVGSLALTMLESDHFWIANAIYVSFFAASLVSTAVKLVAYRRGF